MKMIWQILWKKIQELKLACFPSVMFLAQRKYFIEIGNHNGISFLVFALIKISENAYVYCLIKQNLNCHLSNGKNYLFIFDRNLSFEKLSLAFALSPCNSLGEFPSTIWSKTALILTRGHQSVVLNLKLALDSRVYSMDENLILTEYYSETSNGSLTTRILGSIMNGNQSNKFDFIWQRRSNLSQFHIKVVYSPVPPFLEVYHRNNKTFFEGVFGGVFHLLQQKLSFQYTALLDPKCQVSRAGVRSL